ncbi:MAG: hypothetical protein HYV07_28285, partial [Deltaproteobacteria bacterium]|nr:hypothetical protein [Deltaproteobacteria bacterium]
TSHFGDTETRLGVPCAGVIRFPDPNAEVFAPGSQSADASGFARLSSLLTEIENELRAHPCTTTGSACGSVAAVTSARAYQTALKNAVAAANEDRNFFIADFDPAVCPVPTTEELQAQRDGTAGAPVSL